MSLEIRTKDQHHGFGDMRAVLDRPDLFDAVNLHALADPVEIERSVRWLRWEMEQRGYEKDILISDTAPTPFMAYGDATTCTGNPRVMGVIFRPASEEDRCRLADYFDRLIRGDEETIRWTRAFHAEDVVKKVVIAAESGVRLINTAFTEDLHLLKTPLLKAGAGASAWGGMTTWKVNPFTGDRVLEEVHPSFYSLRQLVRYLREYELIARIETADPDVRLYEVQTPGRRFRIAWLDPDRLVLPGDDEPETILEIETDAPGLLLESVIREPGREEPTRRVVEPEEGVARLLLTRTPMYIFESSG